MALWRLTAKRDMGNVIKKGTTVTVSIVGTAKPQFHHVKKALDITTSLSPSMTEQYWVFEKLD